MTTCRFEVWNSDLTAKLADVPYIPDSASADDPEGDAGTLQLQVGSDEDCAPFIVHRNYLRLYIADQPAFLSRIEAPLKTQHVTIGGKAKQVITVNSRGWIAMGETSPILPFGGVGGKPSTLSRPMSVGSPESETTDSPWFAAVVLWSQIAAFDSTYGTDPPWFKPWYPPRGWPDKTAAWLSCRTYNIDDPTQVPHPTDEFHAVCDVTVPADDLYQLWVAADDSFILEVDGIDVGAGAEDPGDSFVNPWAGCWQFTAGVHRIHLVIKNYGRPVDPSPVGTFGRANRGTFAFAMYRLPNGASTVIDNTLLVAHSDSSWRVTDYGVTPPSPTVGVQARVFLTEMQAAGLLPAGLSITCTDTLDSAGAEWVPSGDQVYSTDDDNWLTFLRALQSNGCADVHQRADGLAVDLFNYGTNIDHVATFDEGDGLQDLAETSVGECNSLQVRYKDGLTVVEDATSIDAIGRIRKPISLAELDLAAATMQAQAILAERATPSSSWTAEIEVDAGTSDAPYGVDGWGVGYSPTIKGNRLRCVRMATQIGADGNPTFRPEFETRLQTLAERQEIWLSKGAPGTLAGTSRAATPLEGMDAGITAGFVQLVDDSGSEQYVVPTTDAPYNLTVPWQPKDNPVRIGRIDLRQDVANITNPTTVAVVSNGVTLFSISLAVGQLHQTAIPGYGGMTDNFVIDPLTSNLQFLFTSCDPDTGDPIADARYGVIEVYAAIATPQAVNPKSTDTPW